MPAGEAAAHEIEHGLVDHLADDGEGLIRCVGACEHLPRADGVPLWLIGLDLLDRTVLDASRMLHKVARIDAKFAPEQRLVHEHNAGKVIDAIAREASCDARTNLPDVRYGTVVPDQATEALAVEHADVALLVFG